MAVVHLGLAAAVALPLARMVASAIRPFTVEHPGRLLPAIAELLLDNPPLAVAIVAAIATGVLLSGLVWIFLSGGIIRRLHAPATAAQTTSAAVQHLPGMAALSGYHGILRAIVVLLFAVDIFGIGNGIVRGGLFVLGWSLCTTAVDLDRCSVVLAGAKGYHPWTLGRGFVDAVAQPKVWLASGLLSVLGVSTSVATLAIASHSFGDAGLAIFGARALAVFGIGLGLWRVAVAVRASEDADA